MSKVHTTGLISEGNYEVNFIKGNTHKQEVELRYEGVTPKAVGSGKYYVLLDATSQDGSNHYYQVVELVVPSGATSPVTLDLSENWSSGQKYSNNWTDIKASIITPKGENTIQTGAVKPQDGTYDVPYLITDYTYAYQEKETSTENHVQHDKFVFKLQDPDYEDTAFTPYDVLGDGAEFGIVANRYEQYGHTETNMAVNSFKDEGGNIDLGGAGDAVMPFYVGSVDEGSRAALNCSRETGSYPSAPATTHR